jgi:hypothetical protein
MVHIDQYAKDNYVGLRVNVKLGGHGSQCILRKANKWQSKQRTPQ